MAYERSDVPVTRSQSEIRKLIMANGGTGIAFVSQTEPRIEGVEATVALDGKTYRIRLAVPIRSDVEGRKLEQEERRIWRVLFYHIKNTYETALSGVIDLGELLLPFVVTDDGRTIGQRMVERLPEAVSKGPLMLTTGKS